MLIMGQERASKSLWCERTKNGTAISANNTEAILLATNRSKKRSRSAGPLYAMRPSSARSIEFPLAEAFLKKDAFLPAPEAITKLIH